MTAHPLASAIGELPSMRILPAAVFEIVYSSLGTLIEDVIRKVWFLVSWNVKTLALCGSLLLTKSWMPWVECVRADVNVKNAKMKTLCTCILH